MGRQSVPLACVVAAAAIWGSAAVAQSVCDEDCRPVVERISGTCVHISATMDGGVGAHSIDRSRRALKETIDDFRRSRPPGEGWMGRLRITPMKPRPNPYMRGAVTRDLMLGESRSRDAYTICWRGVVAPAVCTSGARVCR